MAESALDLISALLEHGSLADVSRHPSVRLLLAARLKTLRPFLYQRRYLLHYEFDWPLLSPPVTRSILEFKMVRYGRLP